MSGRATAVSDLVVELDSINAAALVTNFKIKEEAEQKKKVPEESQRKSSHKKESNFPLLRHWKEMEMPQHGSSGKATVASDLEVELDSINAAALVTNFKIKEEAEQKKKVPEESQRKSSHKKESNFPLLRHWREMEMCNLKNERNKVITPHNQVISVNQVHSKKVEKDQVPAVLNSDDLKKYEADKKSDMIQKTTKIVSNEIEAQEQLRVAVHSKRDSVRSKLLISRLRAYAKGEKLDAKDIKYLDTLKPPDSHWHQNLGAEAVLCFHNNSNMHAAIASGHAASLAITAGEDKAENESNEEISKKRDEIDEKFEKFDQSSQQNIDEAKKMTSGTRTELKRLDLIGKVAEQSQGSYQSEFIAKLNEEVTPQNSSSNSEACYQKMVQIDFSKLN